MFLLHISFILMLIGGGLTSQTAIRGTLHLSPDVESESFMDDSGLRRPLPLAMRLDTFCIEYYPGMSFPRDFHSRVEAGGDIMEISMNRVGRTGGWRFYQTSFDDAGGTILSVSHDPWGTGVSYAGYLLFALAGGWMLLRRYLHVGRGGGAGRGIVVLVVLLVSGVSSSASAVPVVPESGGVSRQGGAFRRYGLSAYMEADGWGKRRRTLAGAVCRLAACVWRSVARREVSQDKGGGAGAYAWSG